MVLHWWWILLNGHHGYYLGCRSAPEKPVLDVALVDICHVAYHWRILGCHRLDHFCEFIFFLSFSNSKNFFNFVFWIGRRDSWGQLKPLWPIFAMKVKSGNKRWMRACKCMEWTTLNQSMLILTMIATMLVTSTTTLAFGPCPSSALGCFHVIYITLNLIVHLK